MAFGLAADPAQFLDETDIGPPVPRLRRILRTEQGQRAHHARAPVARLALLPIETLDQQDIAPANGGRLAVRHGNTAGAREAEHGLLDPRMVPRVIRPVEFGDP